MSSGGTFGMGTLRIMVIASATALLSGPVRPAVAEAGLADPQGPGRILRFPKDRVVGSVWIRDRELPRQLESFYYWSDDFTWEFLAPAVGEVSIPEGRWASLTVSPSGWKDLSFLKALAGDDLYRLTFQSDSKTRAGDACMPQITHLTGLKVLELRYTRVTSKGLRAIGDLQSLERLALPEGMTNAGLGEVAGLGSLKGLYFMQNEVTDAGLAQLGQLTRLEELELGGQKLTNAGLAHLAKLPSLNYLMLSCENYSVGGPGENFRDAGLGHLRKVPKLKTLCLKKLPITDAGMVHLADLAALENLNLRDTLVTDAGLVHLRSMRSLKRLDLYRHGRSAITDAGAVHLKECRSLEYLALPDGFTERGLAELAGMTNLVHLDVSHQHNSPLGDAALEQIARLGGLKYLDVGGMGITDAGMSHIASLTKLEELHLLRVGSLTDTGLGRLAKLKNLRELMVPSSKVTSSGLGQLNSLVKLRTLYLGQFVFDDSPLDLSGLADLENLYCRSQLRDWDTAWLAGLRKLKVVFFGRGVTDAGLVPLKGKDSVCNVALGGPGITDASLKLLGSMKGLRSLQISGNFTNDGLSHLWGLPALDTLHISSEKTFSRAALDRLQRSLPCLRSLNARRYPQTTSPAEVRGIKLEIGDEVPAVVVETLDGRKLDLKQLGGKTVLLYFWATWCSPCVATMPQVKALNEELIAKYPGFMMIGLSLDDSESRVREFVAKQGLTWPQVRLGLQSEITAKYGDDNVPRYLLIGPDNRVMCTSRDPSEIEAAVARVMPGRPAE